MPHDFMAVFPLSHHLVNAGFQEYHGVSDLFYRSNEPMALKHNQPILLKIPVSSSWKGGETNV